MITRVAFLFFFALTGSWLHAQRYWTLDECVNTALKNNISLKQRDLTKRSAESDLTASRMNLLPSINAQATNNWNIGFAINPVTNSAERDVTFRSNNFGLNSSVTLFNGFQNLKNVSLQQSNVKANEHDLQTNRNTIALNVCNSFLQALLNLEITENRKLQVQTTISQVERQEKMYELGASNKTKLLQLKAQLSNEELLLVTAENQLAQAYLTLWQTMNILPDTLNQIQRPEFDVTKIESEIRTTNEVYEIYLQNSPEVKAAEQRKRSAEISSMIATGARSPRLTLSAGLNSFYSTQNQRGAGTTAVIYPVIGTDINNNPVTSTFPQLSYQGGLEIVPFKDQLDRNFGKNIGLTFAIPVFNGGQVNNNVQKQRINAINAELNEQQTRNDTYKSVTQAHLDFKSAQKKYESNVNNLDANKEAFSLADGQFNLGALSINDYLQTKNAYLQAETNFLQAKYELVFRRKVLDFYLGKPLY